MSFSAGEMYEQLQNQSMIKANWKAMDGTQFHHLCILGESFPSPHMNKHWSVLVVHIGLHLFKGAYRLAGKSRQIYRFSRLKCYPSNTADSDVRCTVCRSGAKQDRVLQTFTDIQIEIVQQIRPTFVDSIHRDFHGHALYTRNTHTKQIVERTRTATRSCQTRKRAFHFYSPGVVPRSHAAAEHAPALLYDRRRRCRCRCRCCIRQFAD